MGPRRKGTMHTKEANDTQLRVVLPRRWVNELDAIAAAHFMTRLAAMRQLLRRELNRELENLTSQLEQIERFNVTTNTIRERADVICQRRAKHGQ